MGRKMEKKENDKRLHNKNFFEAWKNAVNGIIYGTTTQSNVRKQLVIIACVMVASLFFNLSKLEFICLIFSFLLIIFAEMINTAIETVVDLYTDLYHPKAKIAKDVAAGAVVISALNALVITYFILFDKIGIEGTSIIKTVINSPGYLAFVAISLVIIVTVALKAAKINDRLHKKQLIVSGQSMIAFSAVTAIWINTENIVIVALALTMAIIISLNRIESNQRTILEVVLGAVLGILITLLVYGLTILK